MTERIEIYPKDTPCFFAIAFTGVKSPGLEQVLDDMGMEMFDTCDEGRSFIGEFEGDLDGDFIETNEYFVRCGPLWIVMTGSELTDEFRIG